MQNRALSVPVFQIIAALQSQNPRDVPEDVLIGLGGLHGGYVLARADDPRQAYWPRVWAARALCYQWDDRALEPLITALRDPAWRVREMSIRALDLHAGSSVFEELTDALRDSVPRVRAAAARALGRTSDLEALKPLSDAFWDADPRPQRAIERALETLERSARRSNQTRNP